MARTISAADLDQRLAASLARIELTPEYRWRMVKRRRPKLDLSPVGMADKRISIAMKELPSLMEDRMKLMRLADFKPWMYPGLRPGVSKTDDPGWLEWCIFPDARLVAEYAEVHRPELAKVTREVAEQIRKRAGLWIRDRLNTAKGLSTDDIARCKAFISDALRGQGSGRVTQGRDTAEREREWVNAILKVKSPWKIGHAVPEVLSTHPAAVDTRVPEVISMRNTSRKRAGAGPSKPARAQKLQSSKPASPPTTAIVRDAEARHQARRRENEQKLREDPAFIAESQRGKQYDEAMAAVAAAKAPIQAELDALIAKHPVNRPGSKISNRIKALRCEINDTERRVLGEHGVNVRHPFSTPADLIAGIKAIKWTWLNDLDERTGTPRTTDLLWSDAERMWDLNPALPPLPEKPEDGRQRVVALYRWCQRCQGLREEQTTVFGPVGRSNQGHERDDVYRDSAWIRKATLDGITSDLLSKMVKRNTLTDTMKVGSRHVFNVLELASKRPSYAHFLRCALEEKADFRMPRKRERARTSQSHKAGQTRTS